MTLCIHVHMKLVEEVLYILLRNSIKISFAVLMIPINDYLQTDACTDSITCKIVIVALLYSVDIIV